jgi:3',5'-cyclic AMP phosphodiesterase CpdA
MSAIRILHASDIHLGSVPKRRSLIDRALVTKKLVNDLLSSLKSALLTGELTNLKQTFKGTFSNQSIALLEQVEEMVENDQRALLNEKIDQILSGLASSEDALFRDFIADMVRKITFATSYHPLALDSLVNFAQSQDDLRAIVLSGDIATTGFEHDLLRAKEFLEGSGGSTGPFAASEPVLSNLTIPVWILPGNHDRFTYSANEWLFSPGGTLFEQILSKHWTGRVKCYTPPLRDSKDALSVLMLGADFSLKQSDDSTHPHRFNKLAQGKIYEEILDELETETVSQQERERHEFPTHQVVTLWAVHFPPFFPDIPTSKGLLKEVDLTSTAEKLNVDAILAGHTHVAKDYPATPRVRILCAGSPTQYDSTPKHCQIVSVSKTTSHSKPSIDVTNYEWDKENVTFQQT